MFIEHKTFPAQFLGELERPPVDAVEGVSPTLSIDQKTVNDLLQVIQRWHGEQRTTIAVLHDLDMVREHFPSTLLLARQAIAFGPTASSLTSANLLKARAMTEAWDNEAEWCHDHEAA